MAAPTISSLEIADDKLRILGSEFTRTTTSVLVDDVPTAFDFVSAGELVIPLPAEGAKVIVDKGGVEAMPMYVPADQVAAPAAPDTTTAIVGLPPEAYLPAQMLPGTPPDPDSPAVTMGPAETTGEQGISAKTPYPTGPVTAGAEEAEAKKEDD
jgi:hypothetical protein